MPVSGTETELARNSSRRHDADRWTEIAILRTPQGYKVEIVGRSVRPGEVDRVRTEESPSPHVIVEAIAPRTASTDGQPGKPRLTWVARKTLLEAAEKDPALADALDEFDSFPPA